jgi:beta-glucosidase
MEGRYCESFLAAAGVDAPRVAAEDMSAISTPVDFVGINVYGPDSYVSASDAVPGFVSVPFTAKHPTTNSSWLKIGPAALYWGPRNMAKVWNVTARRPTCQPPTASSTTPTASCSCAAI